MTQLVLIRHAESVFGAEARTAGSSDPDLSPLGNAQAEALAARLANPPFSAVYSSPLLRARRTAERLVRDRAASISVRAGLREMDQGELEGLLLSELGLRYPDLLARWRQDPTDVRLPGGETLSEVQTRVMAVVEELVAIHHGERIAIVGHAFVNGAIICGLLGLPLKAARRFRLDPAGFTVLSLREGEATLLHSNSVDHLVGLRVDL